MKINIKIICCLLLTTYTFAQETITKSVGEFNAVKSFDKISVQLIKSTENKVELSGKESEFAEVVNNNGELKIKMAANKLLKGEDIVAKVYYTKPLYEIIATEGCYISSVDVLSAIDILLSAKEGAVIKVTVDTKKLNGRINTGGKITVLGKAQNQDYILNSGGILQASEVISEQCTITANTGSNANVTASELVDAKVRAGGSIAIYGNPKVIKEKKIVGGKIIKMTK